MSDGAGLLLIIVFYIAMFAGGYWYEGWRQSQRSRR
jgi:hypothetical protein